MKRFIVEILIAALLIIPAIILSIYLKELVQKTIQKKILNAVELKRGSEGYKNWLRPPITTTRSYYLFNITNPIEVVTEPSTSVVHCNDTPPYTYNIKTKKKNAKWSNGTSVISYAVERIFTRDPDRFNPSSVNDTGVFVDLLRATFRSQFGTKPNQAFYALGGNDLFYHRNAVEQLEGFTSDLFKSMQDKMIGPNRNKSGFIYRQNGSHLYNVSIKTDLMTKGEVLSFATELVPFNITPPSYYNFSVYDGLTYPPMLFDKPSLNIFNSDFCGPILITYNESVSMFGMSLHKYKIKIIDINNCTNPKDTNTCEEVDKLDVSKCISDSLPKNTIFLSKPHFYGSSNETMQEMNIQGFQPTADKHDSDLYFEPYSGTPFKATLRIQLNVEAIIDPMVQSEYGSGLEPTKYKGVRRLLPIFWIDQEVKISEEIINKLRITLFIMSYGQYIVIPLAVLLAIIIIVIIEITVKCTAKNNGYTRGPYIKSEKSIHH